MKLFHATLVAAALSAAAILPAAAKPVGCAGGGGMQANGEKGERLVIFFTAGDGVQPGTCAVGPDDQGFTPTTLLIAPMKDQNLVREAARDGGSFTVNAKVVDGDLVASSIISVNVMGGMLGGGDDDDDDGGNGGDDAADNDGHCPAMVATVSIPEPDLDKLNIRSKPNGKVIGTVPEGDPVTVIGHCGGEAAAGIVAGATKVDHNWCQIEEPMAGCVRRKYLDFAGGAADGAAGLVAKKRKKN